MRQFLQWEDDVRVMVIDNSVLLLLRVVVVLHVHELEVGVDRGGDDDSDAQQEAKEGGVWLLAFDVELDVLAKHVQVEEKAL